VVDAVSGVHGELVVVVDVHVDAAVLHASSPIGSQE
jgi:hypothetical protein